MVGDAQELKHSHCGFIVSIHFDLFQKTPPVKTPQSDAGPQHQLPTHLSLSWQLAWEGRRGESSRKVWECPPMGLPGRAGAASSFCSCPHVSLRVLCCSELSLLLKKSLPSGFILALLTVEQVPNCSSFPQPGGGGCEEQDFSPCL